MSEPVLVRATRCHALLLAPHMRQADVDEVWAAAELSPYEALLRSCQASLVSWSWVTEDEVLAMGGVSAGPGGTLCGVGVPWLLGSENIRHYPVAFLRMSLDRLRLSLSMFPALVNMTDARHTASHRWLKWLGFRLGQPVPYGASGLPFLPFSMGM